jgi:hypothetical protein
MGNRVTHCELKRSNYSFLKLRLSLLSTADANSVFWSLYNVDGGSVAMNLDILTVYNSEPKKERKRIYSYSNKAYLVSLRSIKIKERPIKMGGRTTHRTLPPKRTPFQTVFDRWPHLWKVPGRRWISHTYLMWLCGHSLFNILSPEPVLQGTTWLLWRPINKVLYFIRSVGLIKG